MIIRPATTGDHAAIWTILEPVIRAGETYALPRDWGQAAALGYWIAAAHEVFVAEEGGVIVGTYFIHANQLGGGDHVANGAYVTDVRATGRGVARPSSRPCERPSARWPTRSSRGAPERSRPSGFARFARRRAGWRMKCATR